jgi:hypothetical protein
MSLLPVRNHKLCVLLFVSVDTGLSPAILSRVPAVTRNGIFKQMCCLYLMGIVLSRPPTPAHTHSADDGI